MRAYIYVRFRAQMSPPALITPPQSHNNVPVRECDYHRCSRNAAQHKTRLCLQRTATQCQVTHCRLINFDTCDRVITSALRVNHLSLHTQRNEINLRRERTPIGFWPMFGLQSTPESNIHEITSISSL